MKLNFAVLKSTFIVCKLDPASPIPDWINKQEFFSVTHSEDELSVVCVQENIPENIKTEKDWRVFRVEGPLDFSLVGILNNISNTMVKRNISIFVISTFDTDYILVKLRDFENAKKALKEDGHSIAE